MNFPGHSIAEVRCWGASVVEYNGTWEEWHRPCLPSSSDPSHAPPDVLAEDLDGRSELERVIICAKAKGGKGAGKGGYGGGKGAGKGGYGGGKGRGKGNSKVPPDTCSHCGMKGHWKEDCWRKDVPKYQIAAKKATKGKGKGGGDAGTPSSTAAGPGTKKKGGRGGDKQGEKPERTPNPPPAGVAPAAARGPLVTAFHRFLVSKTSGAAIPKTTPATETTLPLQPKKELAVETRPPLHSQATAPALKKQSRAVAEDVRPGRPALVTGTPVSAEPATRPKCEKETMERALASVVGSEGEEQEPWLLDSGTHNHATPGPLKETHAETEAVQTANGVVYSDGIGRADTPLGELDDTQRLQNSPPLLSLGRLCKQKGYDFKWPAHGAPKLIDPRGNAVALRMKGFVPTVSGASVLFEKSREEAESLVNEFLESVLADFTAHQLRLEMGDGRALAGAAAGSFS